MKHTEIRGQFLDFFHSKGHRIVPSDSLVPAGDPTLLFTSAGMAQFKNEFMGHVKGFRRAVSCQKCMRTADLENVGRTFYHHSFFEMLGNFSFGDYFKEQAILWAWEFLTQVLKLNASGLWVSVYEEDHEAYDIWINTIKIPQDKIIKLGQKDNFWPSEAKDKGPNGPCGPCSEIYYDYGIKAGCGKERCSPGCNCGRFVEIWNLVFTQYNRKDGGVLDPLPNKNIDTGMGLERLCAVMQGVRSNFQTDLFAPIIQAVKTELMAVCKESKADMDFKSRQDNNTEQKLHAIADHVRAITFAISDGVAPSNEERGYVIRNILRKAMLHAIELGSKEPFLYKIVYSVSKTMQVPYPELLARHQDISAVIKVEEERFLNTLLNGRKMLEGIIADTKASGRPLISGEHAFMLCDTHGLPMIMIKEFALSKGLGVDENAFNALMEAQRQRSRRSSTMKGPVFIDTGIKEKTEFIGYTENKARAKVLKILLPDGSNAKTVSETGTEADVILDRSVFYPQQGGQEPDTGRISSDKFDADVLYAIKVQDAVLLKVKLLKGNLSAGDIVECLIDVQRRDAIKKNHTAAHLLQSALRRTLGDHVRQQGSMVDSGRIRFDFTHFKALTEDEIKRTENIVNELIQNAMPVRTEEMDIAQAKKTGALAFFGEKYGQDVRVVKAGNESIELCGGTHVGNTRDIGLFRIMREGSVASGVRRIEAVTGAAALEWEKELEKKKALAEQMIKLREEEKNKAKALIRSAEKSVDNIIQAAEKIKNTMLIVECMHGQNMAGLKRVSDMIKARSDGECIVFLAALENAKASLLLALSNGLTEKGLSASVILAEIVRHFSGTGGGRPDMAQGGIKELKDKESLLKKARHILAAYI